MIVIKKCQTRKWVREGVIGSVAVGDYIDEFLNIEQINQLKRLIKVDDAHIKICFYNAKDSIFSLFLEVYCKSDNQYDGVLSKLKSKEFQEIEMDFMLALEKKIRDTYGIKI